MTTENQDIDWTNEEARNAWLDAQVAGLKAKNSELLGINKGLQSKTKEFEDAEAARQTEVEIAKAKAKGDYEAALKKSMEAHEAKYKATEDRLNALQTRLKTTHFQKEVTEILAAEGGIPKLLMPIIQSQTEVDFDDDGNVVTRIKGDDGQVDPALDLKTYIASLKASEDFGAAFRSSAATGSGASQSTKMPEMQDNPWVGKWGDKTFNMTKQAQIEKSDPALAAKLKAAAGK
jgi:hypothetical protein